MRLDMPPIYVFPRKIADVFLFGIITLTSCSQFLSELSLQLLVLMKCLYYALNLIESEECVKRRHKSLSQWFRDDSIRWGFPLHVSFITQRRRRPLHILHVTWDSASVHEARVRYVNAIYSDIASTHLDNTPLNQINADNYKCPNLLNTPIPKPIQSHDALP